MKSYDLASLSVTHSAGSWKLPFARAKLTVVQEYGTFLWYIDVEGVTDERLLSFFAGTEEIDVIVEATTIGGRRLQGDAYFHPNPRHKAAAIRGQGELQGYSPNADR
ncbi:MULTISPECIES: hypothetical protein [Cohnella]|uniref:hypothetical protein n=1 Tax=Cohnella TaxID=329857 RepID=UPI000376916E|nr:MULTISPECIES: hypothetical protein [Cohnella]REK68489.1 MAG: hypothetical protein C6P35_01305 [Cohnella sp.]